MKIQPAKYNVMLAAMRAVVEHFGLEKVKANFAGKSDAWIVWGIWRVAHNNLQYDDKHPFFMDGTWTRIHPHDPTFRLYEEGLHDSHIETALKRICRELGVL